MQNALSAVKTHRSYIIGTVIFIALMFIAFLLLQTFLLAPPKTASQMTEAEKLEALAKAGTSNPVKTTLTEQQRLNLLKSRTVRTVTTVSTNKSTLTESQRFNLLRTTAQ